MLPQSLRLPLRQERNFFQSSRREQTPSFIFYWKKTNKQTRAAVIVPKKAVAKAVKRNMLKRKIRAVVFDQIKGRRGNDLVVVVKKSKRVRSFEVLKEELEQTLGHA